MLAYKQDVNKVQAVVLRKERSIVVIQTRSQ